MTAAASIRYRLRISLFDTDPEIWRLVDVNGELRLDELHEVIQIAMGWRNSHLHEFTETNPYERRHPLPSVGREPLRWTMVNPHDDDPGQPETEWTIARAFEQLNGPLYYVYDFGDSWVHRIELVEAKTGAQSDGAGTPRAHLVGGERRGPFEDSGGVGGYEDKLEALADSSNPDHADIRRWVDEVVGPWVSADPAEFDAAHVNSELARRFDQETDVASSPRALDTVLDRLPVPLQREFRGYLTRIGALSAPAVETLKADEVATVVEPYAWLIRRVGADGLTLTQAGWLPPAVVSEAARELRWTDRWIGKMNREDQTPPIADLRANAQQFGLLRKLKGRLVLTSAAKRLLDDPVELWNFLARAVALRHNDPFDQDMMLLVAVEVASGRHPDRTDYAEPIAFALDALDWVRADNQPLSHRDVSLSMITGWRVFESLNLFERDKWQMGSPTAAGRAFAQAVLLA